MHRNRGRGIDDLATTEDPEVGSTDARTASTHFTVDSVESILLPLGLHREHRAASHQYLPAVEERRKRTSSAAAEARRERQAKHVDRMWRPRASALVRGQVAAEHPTAEVDNDSP